MQSKQVQLGVATVALVVTALAALQASKTTPSDVNCESPRPMMRYNA